VSDRANGTPGWNELGLWDPRPIPSYPVRQETGRVPSTSSDGRGSTAVISSQALTSLTNALFGVELARIATPRDLGVLSILISVYVVAIAATRVSCSDLYVQVPVDGDESKARRAVAEIGVLGGAATAAIGMAVPHRLGLGIVVLVLGMPFLMLQDFERYVSFRNRPVNAVVGDVTWCGLLLVSAGGALVAHRLTSTVLVVVWVASGAFAFALMRFRVGGLGGTDLSSGWWRAHPKRARAYFAELVVMTVSQGLMVPMVALRYGLIAAGEVRVYLTFIGPSIFGVQAASLLCSRRFGHLPSASRYLRDRTMILASAAGGLGFGAMALVARIVGTDIGVRVLGPAWLSIAGVWRLMLAQALMGPLLIGPMIVVRVAQPGLSSVVRGVASISGLLVVALFPVETGLSSFVYAVVVTQSATTALVLLSFPKMRSSSGSLRV
jgi:hypothetical protein